MLPENCPDRRSLELLLLGKISGELGLQLETHLLNCAACAAISETLNQSDDVTEAIRLRRRFAGDEEVLALVIERGKQLHGEIKKLGQNTAVFVDQSIEERELPAGKPFDPNEISIFAPPEQSDEIGRLGEYRVLEVLGSGGMGIVFRAEDTKLNRQVALKVMRPDLAETIKAKKRFLNEARAIAAIEHDHIVSIYQVGEESEVPFIAMQYLHGESLQSRLNREEKLASLDVVRIGREIADGLAAAHERGLIHRDIKPSNIWLQEKQVSHFTRDESEFPQSSHRFSFRCKILDFGLVCSDGNDGGLTLCGVVLGTPMYMSPEQARGKSIDHRCDLFSLGSVLYRVATGQPAFSGANMTSTLLAVAKADPTPVSVLAPDLPPKLGKLIMKLLAKNRNDRPASAAEVVRTLSDIERELATQNAPDASALKPSVDAAPPQVEPSEINVAENENRSTPRRNGRGSHRLWRIGAAVMLSGFLLAAAIVILLRNPGRGDLVITAAEDVEITVRQVDGEAETIQLTSGRNDPIKVSAGRFEIAITGSEADHFELDGDATELVMRKGEQIRVQIVRKAAAAPNVDQDETGPAVAEVPEWPVDRLHRDKIDPYELMIAGGGDSDNAAREIVAIFGDTRWNHGGLITSAVFSSDGRSLVSLGGSEVIVWDVETGRARAVFSEPSGWLEGIALSPDDKLVAVGSHHPGSIGLWDVETGKQVRTLGGESEKATFLAFLPDRETLISVNRMSGMIKLWEINTGQIRKVLAKDLGELASVAIDSQGRLLAMAGSDKVLRVLDLETGTEKRWDLETEPRYSDIIFHPDSQTLLCNDGGNFVLLDLNSGEFRSPLGDTPGWRRSLAYRPDGKFLAASNGARVELWDVENGKMTSSFDVQDDVHVVTFSPDGHLLATGGEGHAIKLWDAQTGQERAPDGRHSGPALSVDVSRNGELLAWGYGGGTIEVHNISDAAALQLVQRPFRRVTSVEFQPNGNLLAASYSDGSISLWDPKSGTQTVNWTAPSRVNHLAFSPDGRRLVSSGDDGIRIWDATTGREQANLPMEYPGPEMTAFLPMGQRLFSISKTQFQIWDIGARRLLAMHPIKSAPPSRSGEVAIHPGGRIFAHSGNDEIRLYQMNDGEIVEVEMVGRHPQVHSLCFSPDGKTLVSADAYGGLVIWTQLPDPTTHPANGESYGLWKRVRVDNCKIHQIRFTPDGRHLVIANARGTVSVLRLENPPPHARE
jgi:WD40 repeat protein/serine/threonine protein kinase